MPTQAERVGRERERGYPGSSLLNPMAKGSRPWRGVTRASASESNGVPMTKALVSPGPCFFIFSGPSLSAPLHECSPTQSGCFPLHLHAFVPSVLLSWNSFAAPPSFHPTFLQDHSLCSPSLQYITHLLRSYCMHGLQGLRLSQRRQYGTSGRGRVGFTQIATLQGRRTEDPVTRQVEDSKGRGKFCLGSRQTLWKR